MLTLNEQIPNISLPSHSGKIVNLQDLKGKYIVLYFYPKDDTSGCTKEAIGFSEQKAEFDALNAVIFGVSKDTVTSHCDFRDKYDLQVELLSDEDGKVVEMFGCWIEKSMYGKKFMGIDRATFLIDQAGKIITEWRKVKVTGHVDAVLEALRAV